MANIIISYWTENGEVFYDGLGETLSNMGNNVMLLHMHDYIEFKFWGTTFTLNKKGLELLKHILEFEPDIVIAFNNMFPVEYVKELECPICVIDADTFDVGFWNKEELKNNKDRYIFLGMQTDSRSIYENRLGAVKQYLHFPSATLSKSKNSVKLRNISFIGSNFLCARHFVYHYDFVNERWLFRDILDIYKTFDLLKDNNFDKFKDKYSTIKDDVYLRRIFEYFHYHTVSGMNRIKLLSCFSDLGLELWGLDTWRELLYYDIELAKCYNDVKVSTLEENLEIYNSSKISINISHQQAGQAFSWRVMDIMASSSCLLTEDKKDWHDLFGEYISDEVKEAIIYKDRYDARQKAIRLLEDEELRLRCVKECNYSIEQNGRWEHRFKKLSEYLNINFFSNDKGRLEILRHNTNYIKTAETNEEAKITEVTHSNILKPRLKYYQNMQYRNRWLGFINLFQLMLAQIPLVDLLFFKRKKRRELLEKINRYWR